MKVIREEQTFSDGNEHTVKVFYHGTEEGIIPTYAIREAIKVMGEVGANEFIGKYQEVPEEPDGYSRIFTARIYSHQIRK